MKYSENFELKRRGGYVDVIDSDESVHAAFLLKNPYMRGTWLARRESCTHVQCRGLKRKHVGSVIGVAGGFARARALGGSHFFMLTLHLQDAANI